MKHLIEKFSKDVDYVGIRVQEKDAKSISCRDGQVEGMESGNDNGVMVEVIKNGALTYAATSTIDDESITKAFEQAKYYADKTNSHFIHKFDPSFRSSERSTYKSGEHGKYGQKEFLHAMKCLVDKSKELKAGENIVSSSAWSELVNQKTSFYNSLGAEIEQDFNYYYFSSMATGKKGDEIQTRTSETPIYQNGINHFEQVLHNNTANILSEVNELLDAPNCPVGKMDLMLYPDQLYLQIHESIGHPLELDRILGDERNYAGWSFVSPEDFGKLQYGSDLLNITFDPTLKTEAASFACDDAGIKATKEFLIKDGKLVRGIGGIESQKRSGLPGVATQRATSWNRAPIDRMGNINMEPGNSTLDEMIKSIVKGVIMKTNSSWSIDDYRNKFQFGCQIGYYVENGKIQHVVKNPNYKGISLPFWRSLKMVGNSDTQVIQGSPFCGKGEPNQVIRVGHACPVTLFGDVDVFGGGQ
jgi:predicted Zn-dependent protease